MTNDKHNITAQAFYDMICETTNDENLVIIDIRTKDEFEVYNISNSIHIDFYSHNFADEIDALDRNKTYLIYCRTGRRSGTAENNALDLMLKLGFTNVYNMCGGIHSFVKVPGADDILE